MKNFLYAFLFAFQIIMLNACNSENERYIPVQLSSSNAWSILDLSSGEIIYEDYFTNQPSPVYDDIFVLEDENGDYNVFNIKDADHPINDVPYKDISSFNDAGIALATKPNEEITIINRKCEVLKRLDPSIVECWDYSENGTAVYMDYSGKKGLIDKNGQVVIKAQYDILINSSQDDEIIAGMIKNDEKFYSIIDTENKTLYQFTSHDFQIVGTFSEGWLTLGKEVKEKVEVYLVNKKGERTKFGYLDDKDNNRFFNIMNLSFKDGLIPFFDGHAYGIKDMKCDIIIPAEFESLRVIKKDIILAKKNGKLGIINSKGESVLPFDYTELFYCNDNRYIAGDYDNYSLIDVKGNTIGLSFLSSYSYFLKYATRFGYFWSNSARSNVFDVSKHVQKLTSLITDSSCNKIIKDTYLEKFRHLLLSNPKYYKNVTTIRDIDVENGMTYKYYFDGPIFIDDCLMEYVTKCVAVEINYHLKDFDITSEEKLVNALEPQLTNLGFRKSDIPYYFENDKGIFIGIGWQEGDVVIFYCFDKGYIKDINRFNRS